MNPSVEEQKGVNKRDSSGEASLTREKNKAAALQ